MLEVATLLHTKHALSNNIYFKTRSNAASDQADLAHLTGFRPNPHRQKASKGNELASTRAWSIRLSHSFSVRFRLADRILHI